MTDEIFIIEYLERDYIVVSKKIGFFVRDKDTNTKYTPREFTAIALQILGSYRVSPILTSRQIVENWVTECIHKLSFELEYFLHDCWIELGNSEWIVYKPNHGDGRMRHIITLGSFLEDFEERFPRDFLVDYYNNWHINKVTVKTEEIMSEWET